MDQTYVRSWVQHHGFSSIAVSRQIIAAVSKEFVILADGGYTA